MLNTADKGKITQVIPLQAAFPSNQESFYVTQSNIEEMSQGCFTVNPGYQKNLAVAGEWLWWNQCKMTQVVSLRTNHTTRIVLHLTVSLYKSHTKNLAWQ